MTADRDPYRRVRPERRRHIALACAAALVLLVVLGASIESHPEFGIDGWFGFWAVLGFLAAVALTVLAKLIMGPLLRRPDDYYDDV